MKTESFLFALNYSIQLIHKQQSYSQLALNAVLPQPSWVH